jgi:hypothetical protein
MHHATKSPCTTRASLRGNCSHTTVVIEPAIDPHPPFSGGAGLCCARILFETLLQPGLFSLDHK